MEKTKIPAKQQARHQATTIQPATAESEAATPESEVVVSNTALQRELSNPQTLTRGRVLDLQARAGNKAVMRLLGKAGANSNKAATTVPAIQRTLALTGNEGDKDKAMQMLNSLVGDVIVTVSDNAPWLVNLGDTNTAGGRLVKALVEDGQAFTWDISSNLPANYASGTHTIHMNVNGVSQTNLPAKGDSQQNPEGNYQMAGNEHIYLGHEMNHALRHIKGHAKNKYNGDNPDLRTDQWVNVQTTSNGRPLNYYMQLEEAENIGLRQTLQTEANTEAWGGTSENAFLAQHRKPARIGYFQQNSLNNKLNRLDYLGSLTRTTEVRFGQYKEKVQALKGVGGAYVNQALTDAVGRVTGQRAQVDELVTKAKAAANRGTDWAEHKRLNVAPRLDQLNTTRQQAQNHLGAYNEEAAWNQWVAADPARAQIQGGGFNTDWNEIVDPAVGTPAYNSAWAIQMRAINAEKNNREAALTAAQQRVQEHTAITQSANEAGLAQTQGAQAMHNEIIREVETAVDQLEPTLVGLVNAVLVLMKAELDDLQGLHGNKPGYPLLQNLVETWKPVTAVVV